jgi:hypothetical protein
MYLCLFMELAALRWNAKWGVREKCGVKIASLTGAEKFTFKFPIEGMHLRWISKSRMSRKICLPPCIYVDNNPSARCPREFLNERTCSLRSGLWTTWDVLDKKNGKKPFPWIIRIADLKPDHHVKRGFPLPVQNRYAAIFGKYNFAMIERGS